MKTTIEVNGFEIVISEENGVISVSAMKDGEMMEEFEIQTEETEGGEDMSDDDMSDFEEFGSEEEEDFEGQDDEESQDEEDESQDESQDEEELEDEEESQDEEELGKLESFQSFFNKKSKLKK
jgi:hypothetical protein